jgi:hypothetical protein
MFASRSPRVVMARFGLVASLSLAAGGALAQDHYDVAGTRIPAFALLDGCLNEGACAGPNSATNPLYFAPAIGALNADGGAPSHVVNTPGSAGHDYSANAPAPPNVGANFGASGPYANYVLIASVPANASRIGLDVENLSGAPIAIVLDDGTAANGSAPANASVFALAGGAGVGAQGGSWISQSEKGRVQVYAPASTAQVMVRQN